METSSISGGGGMASLVTGAIKDTTGLQVINKTLSSASGQPETGASMQLSINDAVGKGTRLDLRV